MKAYKGFNRNEDGILSCLNMVYKHGKTYKHEGEIKLCGSGFHACRELWQVWPFYPNNGKNAFYEVECGGDIIESDDDVGKFVCSEIKLVREINMTDVARFDGACGFSEGFAVIRRDGKWNFINTEGKFLSEQWFDFVWRFSEGFARVRVDDKYNFIDTEGKLLSEQWFDYAYDFSEGFANVKLDRKYNFISSEGKLLSYQWYDGVCSFSEGLATVQLNGKWNFIDTEGKLLSEKWFDDIWNFSEGFARVKLDGKWIKINTKGELMISY